MVILLILEKLVLSRIFTLSLRVKEIGRKADPSARIVLSGKDEVTSLGFNINDMLTRLEQMGISQKENESFNFALIEDSPNPIEVINLDGSLRYVNPALERITGYSKAQLLGRKPPYPSWCYNEQNQRYNQSLRSVKQGCKKERNAV